MCMCDDWDLLVIVCRIARKETYRPADITGQTLELQIGSPVSESTS